MLCNTFCEIGKGRWTKAKEAQLKEHLEQLKHKYPSIYEQLGAGKNANELKEHTDPGHKYDEDCTATVYEPTLQYDGQTGQHSADASESEYEPKEPVQE